MAALLDGRLENAVTTLGDLVAQAERAGQDLNGRANASAVFLRLSLHLGRVEEALAFYSELRRAVSGEASDMYVPAVALCLAHLGRRDEARENLVRFMGAHPLDPDAAPLVLVQLLEAAVLVEDHARAATLSEWLAGQAARAIAGSDPTCIARHVGAARMLLGDQVSARTSYLHALEVAGRVRFRPELALIHLQLAELGLAQSAEPGAAQERADRRSEALQHLNVAIPELRDMQMQPAFARASALHDRIAAPVYPDRLTAREVEILCRIAAGRTNQEIAEDLILSIRTVERHITNLYGKIGARGKADATTYALRQGLA